jgi:hypothetical protein
MDDRTILSWFRRRGPDEHSWAVDALGLGTFP